MNGKLTRSSIVMSLAVLLCLIILALTLAHAQFLRIEMHQVVSTTLTDQQFLTGVTEGAPVTLAGELRIPRPGADRLPAVILLHGSGGLSGGREAEWALELNGIGVATLMLDSFTGRGIVSTGENQAQLGRLCGGRRLGKPEQSAGGAASANAAVRAWGAGGARVAGRFDAP